MIYKNINPSNQSSVGTSYHGAVIHATPNQLKMTYGEPQGFNDGEGKVNLEWTLELEDGQVITIYDWKYYRPLNEDEMVCWHIGSRCTNASYIAQDLIRWDLEEMGF